MTVTALFGKANPMCGNNPVRIIQWHTGFPCKPWDPISRKHLTKSEESYKANKMVYYSVWWNLNLGNL